jgi:hypothetical protein
MRHERARPRPGGTTVVLGEHHPMATELRALGLPKRAALTTLVGRLSASFGEAEVVQVRGTAQSVRHEAPSRSRAEMAFGGTGGEK